MRTLHITFRLNGSIQANQKLLGDFELRLPETWKRARAISFGIRKAEWTQVEYLVLWPGTASTFKNSRLEALEPLGDYDIWEVNDLACRDPFTSPMKSWMNENPAFRDVREGSNPNHVPLTERWKPRSARSV